MKLIQQVILAHDIHATRGHFAFIGIPGKNFSLSLLSKCLKLIAEKKLCPSSLHLEVYAPLDEGIFQNIIAVIKSNSPTLKYMTIGWDYWESNKLIDLANALRENQTLTCFKITIISSNSPSFKEEDVTQIKMIVSQFIVENHMAAHFAMLIFNRPLDNNA